MMPRSSRTLALLLLLLLCPRDGVQAQGRSPEERAVLAVTDSALAAISRSDFTAFTDLMLDSAVTASVREVNGTSRIRFRQRAQERRSPAGNYTERGFDAEVRVSGPIAMVWLPYDFYRDGQWSHCGVDAFTLLRTDGGWRIATLVWSVEQPPACQPHPDGPPPGAEPERAP
jgi:hypothetical protein